MNVLEWTQEWIGLVKNMECQNDNERMEFLVVEHEWTPDNLIVGYNEFPIIV